MRYSEDMVRVAAKLRNCENNLKVALARIIEEVITGKGDEENGI